MAEAATGATTEATPERMKSRRVHLLMGVVYFAQMTGRALFAGTSRVGGMTGAQAASLNSRAEDAPGRGYSDGARLDQSTGAC